MIEKILERLEEKKKENISGTIDFEHGLYVGYKGAIQIVQEVTKEYGNGWIPCSERLPEVTNSYLVTKMCENDGNPIYDTCHEIFYTRDNKWDCERDEYCEWKVTAWQNKLVPYQKGE